MYASAGGGGGYWGEVALAPVNLHYTEGVRFDTCMCCIMCCMHKTHACCAMHELLNLNTCDMHHTHD